MEGELFVDGQPPDFSVLQELLCPPCLESEPSRSPIPNPKGVGPEAAATRESRFESFVGMACCLPTPDSKALSFLQESAQLLSQPRATSVNAGRPPSWQAGGAAQRPKHNTATAPRSGSSPGVAVASFAPLDALSLISLHCSSLELDPAARIAPAEVGGPAPAPEGPRLALSKDCGGDLPLRAPGRKPVEAPAPLPPGTGAPRKQEPRKCGGRVSRKQPRPRRSCESRDPAFQGVTFQLQLSLCHSSVPGCRLLIRHRYSSGKLRKRSRTPSVKEEDKPGTSEEEDGCPSAHRNKRCASCKTRKTPLWRDAEDGTPLCNACGIRYKKYRIRCFRCWNIPKHGGKPYSHCSNCGGRLHVVTTQQKSGKRCATS
ncbi:GATA-type zinc finger protein 1 [Pogona vitticeps]